MTAERVAILLATRNGGRFVDQQLRSLANQIHPSIDIWVSDDGSLDDTITILSQWQARWTKGVFRLCEGPRKGFAENFRSLVSNAGIDADYYAFCDQDDIWEPHKLTSAIAWMCGRDRTIPHLFCSRTLTVSEAGLPIGMSPLFRRPPSFRNALVQSLAGGNTMVFNRTARNLLTAASGRAGFVSHDWWAYQIVTGAGGAVRYSSEPLVRYRQHAGNLVGANTSVAARLARTGLLFSGRFAKWNDINLAALERNFDLLTPDARDALQLFARARRGNPFAALLDLRRSGVYRQTPQGTLALWFAAAIGQL